MLRKIRSCLAAACLLSATGIAVAQPSAPEASPAPESEFAAEAPSEADALAPAPLTEEEMAAARAEFEGKLHHQTGRIPLTGNGVTLNVPDAFYFLNAADSALVLEEAWGNPPDGNVTGMLFPADMSPLDQNAWGVVLTFEKTGYVSDKDAAGLDYDMLIDAMRDGLDQENTARRAQGYPGLDIIGWATQPRYDAATHKLYWAKEIAFEGQELHTLNYDMRVLGRYGVLSLNFIATVDQLAEIETAAPAVLRLADFDAGSRYQDFNASTDAKSDLGVAGLIGGAAAAAALAKNGGILAALFGFLAKAGIYVVGAIAAAGAYIVRLFTGRSKPTPKDSPERTEQRAATAFFDGPAADEPPAASDERPPPAV